MALSWSRNCGHTDVAKKKSSTFSAASHCHPCGKPAPSIFERTSTWSVALCQRSPTGRAEANIHKSVMSPDQCRQVMRRAILRQVVKGQDRNRLIISNPSAQLAKKAAGPPLIALKPPKLRGMVPKFHAASGKTTPNNLLKQRLTLSS